MQLLYPIAAGSIAGYFGLFIVWFLFKRITNQKVTNERAGKIAASIQEGAMTFLAEEYRIILFVVALVAGGIWGVMNSLVAAAVFAGGSLLSMATGYIGMRAATAANVRTTLAAKDSGEHQAFLVSFFGGGVMGFSVASFGLLGLTAMVYLFSARSDFALLLTAFSLGASLVAFFARVGGGVFTKSADVGADLVGKVEAGIPEDDPRNPAVIADNVGDCVGDTAGMGADIYESYVGAMVSGVILAINQWGAQSLVHVTLPLVLATIGLIGSACGLAFNVFFAFEPAAMLRNATYAAIGVFLASGVWDNGLTSTALTISAFSTVFGQYGGWVVTFCAASFGLGVLVSMIFVARRVWLFLTGGRWERAFDVVYTVVVFGGTLAKVDLIWSMNDVVNACLLLMNLAAIVWYLKLIRHDLGLFIRK